MPTPEELTQMQDLIAANNPQSSQLPGVQGAHTGGPPAPSQTDALAHPASANMPPAAPQPQVLYPQAQPMQPVGPQPIANPLGIAGYLPGASSSTTSSVQLSPEAKAAQKKLDEAKVQEIEAAKRQSEVAQVKTQIQARESQAEAESAHQAVTEATTHQAEQAQLAKQHLTSINRAMADFRDSKVDPDHWWNNRSTGQKIAATLASGLDAMGAAWSRSRRTPTIDAIQHAIDRDIEGQKMAMEAKARGVTMATNAYTVAREAGADDATAKAAVRVASLMEVQKQYSAELSSKTLGPEQKAAADAQLAQLEQQRQQSALHLAELTAKHVSSSSSRTPITNVQMAAMQNGPGGTSPGAMSKPQAINYARDLTAMAKREGITIDGNMLADALATGRLPTKAVEQFQAAMRVKGIQRKLEGAINDYHDAPVGSAQAGKYQALAQTLIGDIQGQAGAAKGQALTAEESKAFTDMLQPPSRSLPSVSMAGIQTAREKEIERARGVVAGVVAPVEGNLQPFGLRGSLSGDNIKVVSEHIKGGHKYLYMSDGSFRDGGSAP